jgi:hypothetical protein
MNTSIELDTYYVSLLNEIATYIPDISECYTPPTSSIDYDDMSDDDTEFVTEPVTDKQPLLVKKCLCTNIIGEKKVCTRQVCTFAHYAEEWQPEKCKFGAKCKGIRNTCSSEDGVCQRLHGKETIEQALVRMGIVFLSKKKYVKARHYIMEANANKKPTDMDKDWHPAKCNDSAKCKGAVCQCLHNEETIEQALARLEIAAPSKKKYVKARSIMEAIATEKTCAA